MNTASLHLDRLIRSLADAIRDEVIASLGGKLVVAPASKRSPNIKPCIAPGCKKPSKGPRFHFLCEEHRGAKPAQIAAWRQEKPAKAAAKAVKAKPAKKTRACIKPGCGKPSKGPRFHYLCIDHRNVPTKTWTAWRAKGGEVAGCGGDARQGVSP